MKGVFRANHACLVLFSVLVALTATPFVDAVAQQAPAASAAKELRIDFEGATVGALPPSFTAALTGKGKPVHWAVAEDTSAPAGPHVLETSADRTSNRFPLAIVDGFEVRNVAVSVRFKPIAGEVDQAAGLMVRVKDADNYYIARANALEDNVRLYKVVDGRRQQFAGNDIEVPNGRWQTLRLTVEGNRLSVSLDGKALFEATDDTFAGVGKIGVWTKADSLTHFDELVARPLP